MKKTKKFYVVALIVALCTSILPAYATSAKIQLNKKYIQIYINQKSTVKLRGLSISKQKFKSSNKKVATVSKKGYSDRKMHREMYD